MYQHDYNCLKVMLSFREVISGLARKVLNYKIIKCAYIILMSFPSKRLSM